MKLTVENFQGCRRASLTIKPAGLTLIGGRNASGKSSVLIALGALLSREPNPCGEPSVARGRYYHNGQEPYVNLSAKNGEVTWAVASSEFRVVGTPPTCIPAAVQEELADVFSSKQKTRAAMWERIFPPPGHSDLLDQLLAVFPGEVLAVTRELCREVAGIICSGDDGWALADSMLRERIRAEKGVWEQCLADGGVRSKYGTQKALTARPVGWHDALEDLTLEQADKRVSETGQALQLATNAEALTEAFQQKLAELREQHKVLRGQVVWYERNRRQNNILLTVTKERVTAAEQVKEALTTEISELEKTIGSRPDLPALRAQVQNTTRELSALRERYQQEQAAAVKAKEVVDTMVAADTADKTKLEELESELEALGPETAGTLMHCPAPACGAALLLTKDPLDYQLREATPEELAGLESGVKLGEQRQELRAEIRKVRELKTQRRVHLEGAMEIQASSLKAWEDTENKGQALSDELAVREKELAALEKGEAKNKAVQSLEDAKATLQKARQTLEDAKAERDQAQTELDRSANTLSRYVGSMDTLAEQIKELEARPKQSEDEIAAVDNARQALETAKVECHAVEVQSRAWRSHLNLQRLTLLQEAVAPSGIRSGMAQRSVAAVSEAVTGVLEAVGLGALRIDEKTFSVSLDGRPASYASASERLVMVVALKLAIAIETGSPVVTCDAADLLDSVRWEAFRVRMKAAAERSEVAIVIAATDAEIPDYTMAGGICKEYGS